MFVDALAHDDSSYVAKSVITRLDKTEAKLEAAKSMQSTVFESYSKLIGLACALAQRTQRTATTALSSKGKSQSKERRGVKEDVEAQASGPKGRLSRPYIAVISPTRKT